MDTSVVILIPKPPNSLLLLHQEERVFVLPLESELRDCFSNKILQKWCSASWQAQAWDTGGFLSILWDARSGNQPPCCAAQATCRYPAESQHPLPHVREDTTRWHQPQVTESSQFTSLSSRSSIHGGAETNHPCSATPKNLINSPWAWQELLHTTHYVLGWLVTQQQITGTSLRYEGLGI